VENRDDGAVWVMFHVKQKKILALAISLFVVVGLVFLSYVFLCIFGYFPLNDEKDYPMDPLLVDNESIGMFLGSFDYFNAGIRPRDIIKPLVIAYPQKPKYLHAKITKYNDKWTEKEEWFFNIDISNINVVVSGEEMKPGIFTRFVGQWVPETISLEDGQWFKAGAYYLISSYISQQEDEIYKKLNINNLGKIQYAIFKVNNDTEIIHNEDGKLDLNCGGLGLFLKEMRLREILINSNSHDGFTLFVTPESINVFKVKEGSVRKYETLLF
jgi:hypothetical protein